MKKTFIFAAALLLTGAGVRADSDLGKRATWTQPSFAEVKAEIDRWLAGHELDEAARLKIEALWPAEFGGAMTGSELLDQFAATAAVVDEEAHRLVLLCRDAPNVPTLSQFELLTSESAPPLVRNNLRLLYARWLAQHDMFDEALQLLDGLQPEDVVDPATLLFYQSVCYHKLLEKEKCLPAIAKLLENGQQIPRRYEMIAHLMEADLRPLKTDSLDEIARLMDNVGRRLDLGRAGKRVRDEEQAIIDKLDKLIEKLEQQAQQMASSSSSGNLAPAKPMDDSRAGGGTGEGNVDPRQIGRTSGWGDLPPKERQEALQQISKELPAHYRQAIEEYFRKLARDGVK